MKVAPDLKDEYHFVLVCPVYDSIRIKYCTFINFITKDRVSINSGPSHFPKNGAIQTVKLTSDVLK